MLSFEGFNLTLQEIEDGGFRVDVVGHSAKFSESGLSPSALIKSAKLECLKILADEMFQSCFIVEKKTGKIVHKNIPLTQKEPLLIGFELKAYNEGVAFVHGLENEKPVTMIISIIDYGSHLKCQIDSIKDAVILSEVHP